MRNLFVLLMLGLSFSEGFGDEKVFDFRQTKVGAMPAGFRPLLGGTGAPGEWKVVEDDLPSLFPSISPGAPSPYRQSVIAQLSRDRTDERFPMFIYDEETFGDFTLTTRFKLVDGQTEQMAGIVFRMQDDRNYYYIRASGISGTLYWFKILNGQRLGPVGNKVAVAKGDWHELTIECKGSKTRALLNGKETIPWLDDPSFGPGKIGFWTKSDSVTHFSETRILYKPQEILAQTLIRDALKKYPRLLGLKIYASTNDSASMKVVSSTEAAELGQAAPREAEEVLMREQGFFYGKGRESVTVTVPLHDSNGDKIAAVRIIMRTFPGQTEKNALVRAMPVVKDMESRIRSLEDLVQ